MYLPHMTEDVDTHMLHMTEGVDKHGFKRPESKSNCSPAW